MLARFFAPVFCGFLLCLISWGSGAEPEQPFSPFADPTFPITSLSVDASPEGAPRTNWVPRGVVVRAGGVWGLYDVDMVRLAAVWIGGFPEGVTIAQYSYQNTKKKAAGGQKGVPRIKEDLLLANAMLPGMWTGGVAPTEDLRDKGPDEKELGRGPVDFKKYARWRGVETDKHGAVIVYETAAGIVRERLQLYWGPPAFQRSFSYEGLTERVYVANGIGKPPIVLEPGTVKAPDGLGGVVTRWPECIEASATRGEHDRDRIALPVENPWRRPVRLTAIAFYDDGRAAVTTVDGDVWMATGLDDTLGAVSWRRFATGLHEPYSAVVRDGELFVFDRGGLKRLHDRNGDGEADHHEWFCHDFWQSAETRDFPHDLELRADGGFYLVKGGQQNDHLSKHSGRVLSVSADGESVEVFSSGHRNAYFGLRRETGELFACDQQGHWVPSSPVQLLLKGAYYGFQPAAPQGVPEPEVARPVTWIPHRAAQSTVDMIVLADGALACIDYFRPGLVKVYPSGMATRWGPAWDFPLLKGAVNPKDGHLYLAGFQIWSTAAKEDAGFGRLRLGKAETKADRLPRATWFGKGGVVLEFGSALDAEAARERGRFHASSWNYQRSEDYGSGYYRADGSAGQDPLAVAGVHRSRDGRKVFVHLPDLVPVDQVSVGYEVVFEGEREAESGEVYFTPHELSELDLARLGFADIDLVAEAAEVRAKAAVAGSEALASAKRGEVLSLTFGCIACHSTDGTTVGKSGPTWKGLVGAPREFIEAEPIESVGADYLREAILDPPARVVKGYNPKDVGMPSYRGVLSDADVESLILYIESIGS